MLSLVTTLATVVSRCLTKILFNILGFLSVNFRLRPLPLFADNDCHVLYISVDATARELLNSSTVFDTDTPADRPSGIFFPLKSDIISSFGCFNCRRTKRIIYWNITYKIWQVDSLIQTRRIVYKVAVLSACNKMVLYCKMFIPCKRFEIYIKIH